MSDETTVKWTDKVKALFVTVQTYFKNNPKKWFMFLGFIAGVLVGAIIF